MFASHFNSLSVSSPRILSFFPLSYFQFVGHFSIVRCLLLLFAGSVANCPTLLPFCFLTFKFKLLWLCLNLLGPPSCSSAATPHPSRSWVRGHFRFHTVGFHYSLSGTGGPLQSTGKQRPFWLQNNYYMAKIY